MATRKWQLEAAVLPESVETRGWRGVAETQKLGPLGGGWDSGQPVYWILHLQRTGFSSRSWNQGRKATQTER